MRTFHIDRSQDHPPVFADSTLSTTSGAALAVQLAATSPDNNPLTYGFVTQPKHGTVQNFDPAAGTFTYVSSSGFVGSETITVFAQDNKAEKTQATLIINVSAVNQSPVAYAQTVTAYSGQGRTIVLQGYDLETLANQLTLVIVSQPTHGTLQITGQNTVVYTSGTTYSGADQFSYAWRDTGSPSGTTSNELTGAAATVSITVGAINHAPTTHDVTVTTFENAAYTFQLADFPFADPNDTPPNTLLNVIISALPTAGSLTLNGSAVGFGTTIAPSDIVAGKLVFTPGQGSGATYARFGFVVEDDGGTANGGLDVSASATMTVSVTPINHAPTTSNATVTTAVNTPYAFRVADFPFVDASDQPPNALLNVIVTSLPGAGNLTLAGQAVTANQKIAATDIAAGKLVFTPGHDEVGTSYATFGFAVEDDGGIAHGGSDTSTAATMAVSVSAGASLTVTINSTAQEGDTLTANPSDVVTGYQWQRDGVDISGATSVTYVVQEADEGHRLRVHVTATGGSADSNETSAVSDIAPTLSTPVISATSAREGDTLTVTTQASANDSDAVVAYQWQSSTDNGTTWTAISGATGTSYKVQEGDENARLRVLASSTDSDGTGTSAASAATSAVSDVAPALSTPVISAASAREDDTLTGGNVSILRTFRPSPPRPPPSLPTLPGSCSLSNAASGRNYRTNRATSTRCLRGQACTRAGRQADRLARQDASACAQSWRCRRRRMRLLPRQ